MRRGSIPALTPVSDSCHSDQRAVRPRGPGPGPGRIQVPARIRCMSFFLVALRNTPNVLSDRMPFPNRLQILPLLPTSDSRLRGNVHRREGYHSCPTRPTRQSTLFPIARSNGDGRVAALAHPLGQPGHLLGLRKRAVANW
jgi:hypothetical protein